MANTIDFNVSTNAVNVLNQTGAAAENTAKGFTSAKAELRALQNQMLQMDQSSAEFKKASARASELKDRMEELGENVRVNVGNSFEQASNSISLFTGRLLGGDLKGAGDALTNLGGAVSRISLKELKSEVGGLIQGFGNLAKAILANPILLLGAAIAAVAMNMDKLRQAIPNLDSALGGLTEKMKAAAKANEAALKARQLEYDLINASTALMKEQGMSDKDILKAQIEKAKALLEQKKITDAQNIANAKADLQRNENLKLVLKGIQEVGLAVPKLMAYVFDTLFSKAKELLSYVGITIDTSIQAYDTIVGAQSMVLDAIFGNTSEQVNAIKEMEDQALLSQTQLANSIAQMGLDINKIDQDNEKRVQTQFDTIESLGMKRIKLNKKVTEDIVSQEDKLAKAVIESQKKVDQHQREILAKRVQMTSDAFGALSSLTMAFNAKSETAARNQFRLNKAFSLSQAIINTYQAVNAALTAGGNPAKLATGAQFVEAGIALTAGLANVIKIQQTQFGGANSAGGGNNLGGVGGGGGGTQAPSPANFAFLGMQPNQQPPLQAYVVSGQVSSNLEAQQLINNQARLGG